MLARVQIENSPAESQMHVGPHRMRRLPGVQSSVVSVGSVVSCKLARLVGSMRPV